MPLAVVLILLVVGSVIFHLVSPWTFTPLASNWGAIDLTIDITFVVTGIVFIAIFMHMKWERLALKLAILGPPVAILVLIAMMAAEGNYIEETRLEYYGESTFVPEAPEHH